MTKLIKKLGNRVAQFTMSIFNYDHEYPCSWNNRTANLNIQHFKR